MHQRDKIVTGISANPPGIHREYTPGRIYSALKVSDPRDPGWFRWPPDEKKAYQPPPSYAFRDFTKPPPPPPHPVAVVGKALLLEMDIRMQARRFTT